ncbi:gap junction Cx32.2 protein-like [Nematolebias whitei]|uniref:gap junction Cx32.2 protein-like n=1 Tax=Nematolebias whitei TaxID=451745 RepID=UPI00189A2EF9|nr:gap junction Cx32.2 protein-like [Nematolebias whitei]
MGDWSYLTSLLDKVQSHSTVVGKIWMSVLFLFRIFVLGAAADKVWGDEVSLFFCDSKEPGCDNACYNWKFPMSHIHYWILQITFVSTPTLVYLSHAIHIIHKEQNMMEHQQEGIVLKKRKYTDERGKVEIKGILFCSYITQLIAKILLEVGFSVGQFYIFGPVSVAPRFLCEVEPCAELSGSQCFVSRPTEKTIFIYFMFVVSGISVLLNIIEIVYLLCIKRRKARKRLVAKENMVSSHLCTPYSSKKSMSCQYEAFPLTVSNGFPLPGLDGNLSDSTGKEKDT